MIFYPLILNPIKIFMVLMSHKALLQIAALLAFAGAVYSMIFGSLVISILNLIISGICFFSSRKF
jgi:hypothetical protein